MYQLLLILMLARQLVAKECFTMQVKLICQVKCTMETLWWITWSRKENAELQLERLQLLFSGKIIKLIWLTHLVTLISMQKWRDPYEFVMELLLYSMAWWVSKPKVNLFGNKPINSNFQELVSSTKWIE